MAVSGMPPALVVEEMCKLLLQLPPEWCVDSSEKVMTFVSHMSQQFDQSLRKLKADEPTKRPEPPKDVDSDDSDASSDRPEEAFAAADMKTEAQPLVDSDTVPLRQTKSLAAWTPHKPRVTWREWLGRAADHTRNALLLFGCIVEVFLVPLLCAFRGIPVSWPLIIAEYILDSVFWVNIILHIWDPFGWYPDFFEFANSRKQYLTGYFWVDLFSVIPIELLVYIAIPELRVIAGFGRLNRVFCIVHFSHSFDHCLRMLWRGMNPSAIRVYWLCLLALLYFHVLACFFYGFLSLDIPNLRAMLNEPDIGTGNIIADYLSAVYWTVNMATGFAANYPITDLQNLISLCLALCGFAVYTYLLGVVVDLISQQDAPLNELRSKLEMVHDYLDYVNAPEDLLEEILSYYRQLWKMCHSFDVDSQDFLEDLPPELQQRIQFTINYALVQRVNIFQSVKDDMLFIADIVSALKPHVCAPEQVVVKAGSPNSEMYFVMKGELEAFDSAGHVVATLKEGQYFGELCLLHGIPTSYSVIAATTCYLYTLAQRDFDYLMEQYPLCLKAILGNALSQIEEAAFEAVAQDRSAVADGQLLDRHGNVMLPSPEASMISSRTHDSGRSGRQLQGLRVPERSDLYRSHSGQGHDIDMGFRFGVSPTMADNLELRRLGSVSDLRDLLADVRAEAKAAYDGNQPPAPSGKEPVVPSLRPLHPIGDLDPLGIRALELTRPTPRYGRMDSPSRSAAPTSARASTGRTSTRRSSADSDHSAGRRSSASSVPGDGRNSLSVSRRTSVSTAPRSSRALTRGHSAGPPPHAPHFPPTPLQPYDPELHPKVRDGLLRWMNSIGSRGPHRSSISQMAFERTRSGPGPEAYAPTVMTLDVDSIPDIVVPRRSSIDRPLSRSSPGDSIKSMSPRSDSFSTSQDTLQLKKTRFRDGRGVSPRDSPR